MASNAAGGRARAEWDLNAEARRGGRPGEWRRSWRAGGESGLEGNCSTPRREDARVQREATRGDGGVGAENGLGGTWQGNSKPRINAKGRESRSQGWGVTRDDMRGTSRP